MNKFLPVGLILDKFQIAFLKRLEATVIELEKNPFFKFFMPKLIKNGIYLYGSIGRGKTILMRAFYEQLTIKKQMVHYQDFMQSIHKNMHKLQGESTSEIMAKLAKEYAHKGKVICIDEFEIKDITDAMIISILFTEFIKCQIFIFVTSNTKPENLYKDGLQRESFLKFIDLINEKFEILHLDSYHDYRLDQIQDLNKRVLYPLNLETKKNIKKVILELTDNKLVPATIQVFGREVKFARTCKMVLVTNFHELFMQELGYADYVNICQTFTIIILENVPVIPADDTDLATRFINFIDNAYFYKILLFITLQDAPEKLYLGNKRAEEFKRAISRLHEMNSNLYIETHYDGLYES